MKKKKRLVEEIANTGLLVKSRTYYAGSAWAE